MKITKKDLEKSQVEIIVELSVDEFQPFIEKGAKNLSEQVKIEGFRPGKVPYDVLKQKVGEISILEEAAHIAIRKNIDKIFKDEIKDRQPVGQPQIEITKLAPGNPLEYKMTIALLPPVTLGEYKGLKIEKEKADVNETDIEKTLNEIREMRAKEVASTEGAQKEDKVVVDLHLSLDKVPVEDGHAHDLSIILGKEFMVPGFDEKIMGIKKGEKRNFVLEYPKKHHQANLAGKMVEFSVDAKEVYKRELPKIDDELAKTMQFKDLNDLKEVIKNNILADRGRQVDVKAEVKMLEAIADKSKFGDIPEALLEAESNNMMAELERNVNSQGGNFEEYLRHLKKTQGELRLEMLPNAIKRIKTALVIREVGLKENISVSQEEIDARLELMKKSQTGNSEAMKSLESPDYRRYLENMMFNDKVVAQLKAWNYADSSQQSKS
jgi:trigger factor